LHLVNGRAYGQCGGENKDLLGYKTLCGAVLLPLQLGSLIKSDAAAYGEKKIKEKNMGLWLIDLYRRGSWFVTIPGWLLYQKRVDFQQR
jgi:hypothetical protein